MVQKGAVKLLDVSGLDFSNVHLLEMGYEEFMGNPFHLTNPFLGGVTALDPRLDSTIKLEGSLTLTPFFKSEAPMFQICN